MNTFSVNSRYKHILVLIFKLETSIKRYCMFVYCMYAYFIHNTAYRKFQYFMVGK